MAKDPGKNPPPNPASEPQNLEEEIRLRAYELYEARAQGDGRDVDDWLQAEEEITKKKIHLAA